MGQATPVRTKKFSVLHLFAGIGGGSLGFKNARFSWRGVAGRFENLLAIDSDPGACESYRRITGGSIECWDLFSRDQYRHFHGVEPPASWREVTPQDLREACGGVAPDVVFTSPPCKGFSGLLSSASAASDRYQALCELTERGIHLALEAFPESPPKVILLENVPRIKSRGRQLLDKLTSLMRRHDYAIDQRDHDCGELGGLGQRRKRFLWIGRHRKSLCPFIYRPTLRPLKTIGDVLGPLPLPDAPEMGPMHRLPQLKWNTWLRLALIPAGGDWRDLQNIAPEEYRIQHVHRAGTFGVMDWDKPAGTVTGATHVANGALCVANVRMQHKGDSYAGSPGLYGVSPWDGQSPTITGSASVSSSNCAAAIADPQLSENKNRHSDIFRVVRFDATAPCIIGTAAIAEPRLGCSPGAGTCGVQDCDQTSTAIIGAMNVHAAAAAVAGPRIPEPGDRLDSPPVVIALDGTWHRPLTTLELAALQSFPVILEDGAPLVLAGQSDKKWREWIGNAVPPLAAQAIAEQIGLALLQNELGETFMLGISDIWVRSELELQGIRSEKGGHNEISTRGCHD